MVITANLSSKFGPQFWLFSQVFYNILSTFQKIIHKKSNQLGHKFTIKGVLHIIYVAHMTNSLGILTFPSCGNCRDQWWSQPVKTFLVPATVFATCLAPSPTASAASLVSPSPLLSILPLFHFCVCTTNRWILCFVSFSGVDINVLPISFDIFCRWWGFCCVRAGIGEGLSWLTQMCCCAHLMSFIGVRDVPNGQR